MGDIIKIVELLEKLGLLADGMTATVKRKKKTRRWFSCCYDGASLKLH